MKKLALIIEILGIVVVSVSVVITYLDMKGIFVDPNRVAVYDWATKTKTGLSLDKPAAKEFMKKFPPPETKNTNEVTHLVKTTMGSELGGRQLDVMINYMYSDTSRSPMVANLSDVQSWINETSYKWISWSISVVGLLILIIGFFLKIVTQKAEQSAACNS